MMITLNINEIRDRLKSLHDSGTITEKYGKDYAYIRIEGNNGMSIFSYKGDNVMYANNNIHGDVEALIHKSIQSHIKAEGHWECVDEYTLVDGLHTHHYHSRH